VEAEAVEAAEAAVRRCNHHQADSLAGLDGEGTLASSGGRIAGQAGRHAKEIDGGPSFRVFSEIDRPIEIGLACILDF
jgi:hypothetical protein